MDTTQLYAIIPVTEIYEGDQVFYDNAVRIVTARKGKAPANIRIATIQAQWPYLSVVHVFEPEDELPAVASVLTGTLNRYSPPDLTPYDRNQGIDNALAAQTAYQNRTP